jgi:TCP-1/cpn60 chaperonin family.
MAAEMAAQGDMMIGIDGETGKLCNVKEAGILDSYAVKQQVFPVAPTALLRADSCRILDPHDLH